MTQSLWYDIAKTLFWDNYFLDKVNSQAIAEILFDAYWGGGGSSLVLNLQRKLNDMGFKGANGLSLTDDGAMGKNTYFALNNATRNYENEVELIKYLTEKRLSYLKTTTSWASYSAGWTNRVNALLEKSLQIASQNRVGSIAVVGGLLYLGYLTYLKIS